MRYCSNGNCDRKTDCLRWILGRKWVIDDDYNGGRWRTRRPGNWVAYASAAECDRCKQFIFDIKTKQHERN